MENDRSPSPLFNPVLAWADLGLRAMEMTLASSQNIHDGLDRIARAGGGVQAPDRGDAGSAMPGAPRAALPATFHPAGNFPRTMFELATEGWLRWMSALGTLASVPAGVGLARTIAKRENPLEAVRSSLRPATWGEKPATEVRGGGLTYPPQRRERDATSDLQHALAAGDAKLRRKPTAKRKGTRRGARK